MAERPILFSGEMIHAILDGRKTQTRRIVKTFPDWMNSGKVGSIDVIPELTKTMCGIWSKSCSFGVPGDRLWVRESGWQPCEPSLKQLRDGADTWPKYWYDADGTTENDKDDFKRWGWKRRPSIHMPRWASRITLEITGVRVERLQDIRYDDCAAEGIRPEDVRDGCPVETFCELWESINGPESWHANPWVWVLSFQRTPQKEGR